MLRADAELRREELRHALVQVEQDAAPSSRGTAAANTSDVRSELTWTTSHRRRSGQSPRSDGADREAPVLDDVA